MNGNKSANSDVPVSIGLVQINNSFSGQNYVPYSVGCLQAYVEQNAANPSQFQFLPAIYSRIAISSAVDHLSSASIVGFSFYAWNANITLEIARRLKELCPDTLIIFGGPHVPDHAEKFVREHRFIDLVVHNEGERTFLNILNTYPSKDWVGQTGISYIDDDGQFVKMPETPRLKDLASLPSPFLSGVFDDLMRINPQENWIGLWESNRGCPFKCTFCDWGSATASKVTKFDMDRLYQELDWFVKHKIEYIFVCDANFGIQKRDVEIAEHVARLRGETGYPHGFSVQNTKNATERAYSTQKILSDAGLNKGVALSMQSLDRVTLENIKRDNISLDTYFELSRRFAKDKVETYSDLILALPGETYDSFCNGVDRLIASGQHNRIQFNNLSILPNAEMGDPAYLERFGMEAVRSEIINIHGKREILDDDVTEYQDLVVETKSMPAEDWIRARSFSWMISFLHFDKVLQLPLLLMNKFGGVSYRTLTEAFLSADGARYPTLSQVRDLFLNEAASIQSGGAEYVYSNEWLGIYWPADEYAFIQLTANNQIDAFYEEAGQLLEHLAKEASDDIPEGALNEAVWLNRNLISQPFVDTNISYSMSYDFLEFWKNERTGNSGDLHHRNVNLEIDRASSHYTEIQDWCREVVWWGNKKGAYLYGTENIPAGQELAGHY
jgi:radical SAM superfamily enzyme YgiQ (UPF0313 family)